MERVPRGREDARDRRAAPARKEMREQDQVGVGARLGDVGIGALERDPVLELGRADELLRQLLEDGTVEHGGLELWVAAGEA